MAKRCCRTLPDDRPALSQLVKQISHIVADLKQEAKDKKGIKEQESDKKESSSEHSSGESDQESTKKGQSRKATSKRSEQKGDKEMGTGKRTPESGGSSPRREDVIEENRKETAEARSEVLRKVTQMALEAINETRKDISEAGPTLIDDMRFELDKRIAENEGLLKKIRDLEWKEENAAAEKRDFEFEIQTLRFRVEAVEQEMAKDQNTNKLLLEQTKLLEAEKLAMEAKLDDLRKKIEEEREKELAKESGLRTLSDQLDAMKMAKSMAEQSITEKEMKMLESLADVKVTATTILIITNSQIFQRQLEERTQERDQVCSQLNTIELERKRLTDELQERGKLFQQKCADVAALDDQIVVLHSKLDSARTDLASNHQAQEIIKVRMSSLSELKYPILNFLSLKLQLDERTLERDQAHRQLVQVTSERDSLVNSLQASERLCQTRDEKISVLEREMVNLNRQLDSCTADLTSAKVVPRFNRTN